MPLINTNKMDNQKTKQLEENLTGREYFGIDPQSGWSRENFVNQFNHLGRISEYEKQIKETKGELGTGIKGDLSDILNGNDFLTGQSDEIVRKAAKDGKKMGEKRMAEWVRNNMSSLYKEVDSSEHADQMYMQLALSTPLCLTGNEEHDYTIGLISKVREAQEAIKTAQDGDVSKMRKIVEAKTKSRKLPEWKQKLIKEFSDDNRLVQALFQEEYQLRQQLVSHNLSSGDGKTADKAKIKSLIDGSLSKKWHFYEEETHDDTKKNIYEKEIMPVYNAIARSAYPIAHSTVQKDGQKATPEIQKYYERAEERAKSGVGVGAEDIVEILDERKKAAGGH